MLFMLLLTACTCSTQQNERAKDTVYVQHLSLFFAGDLMQHIPQMRAAQQAAGHYDYAECFEAMMPLIAGADIAVGNFETTLAGEPYSGYPMFCAPDDYLRGIQKAGFDVMLTANNHTCDKGRKGIERTLAVMDSLGMLHTGSYRDSTEYQEKCPLMIDKNGFRVALLNYTYGTNGIAVPKPNIVNLIDTIIIYKDIARAKEAYADVVIACVHWGEEYALRPNKHQRALTEWMLRNGVDHIIGSHPHVPQPLEVVQDSLGEQHLVAYSLGNFISNQHDAHTDEGYTIRVDLEKTIAIEGDSFGKRRVTLHKAKMKAYEQTRYIVVRPVVGGRKQYRIYPVTMPDSCLNAAEQRIKQRVISFWKRRD